MKTHLTISFLITILIPLSLLGMDNNSPREPQEKKVRTGEQVTIVPMPPALSWPLQLNQSAPEQSASEPEIKRSKTSKAELTDEPTAVRQLFDAVIRGKSEEVERLLQAGGDANHEHQGQFLINWAITGARIFEDHGDEQGEDEQEIKKKCELLKKYGADMDARSDDNSCADGKTPLLQAAAEGLTGVCETLIELGALINLKAGINETTALHLAVDAGFLTTCEFLLKRGADVNATNSHGCTPLDLSIDGIELDHGFEEPIRDLLISYGAHHKNHSIGFRKAVMAGDVDECRVLLEKGAEREKQGGCYFDTPLFCAVRHGRLDVAQLLLQHGAQPNTRNKFNATPLHAAAEQGRTDLCNLLVDAGAAIDASASDVVQETPLIHAVRAEINSVSIATCRSLIEKGANPITSMDSDGRTFLQLIACISDFEPEESRSFYLELIEMGCDPNVGNAALSNIVKRCSHKSPVYKKTVEMAVFVPRTRESDIPLVRERFLRIYWTLLVLNKRLRLPRAVVHQILISNTDLATDLFKLLLLNRADDAYRKTPYTLRKPLSKIPVSFHPMIFQEIYRATIHHLCVVPSNELVWNRPGAIEQEFGEKIKHNSKQKVIAYN